MSLPSEIVDQLLSGYLDDTLSGDERLRVEQMLASDQSLRQELDSMREIRAALKSIDRTDRARSAQFLGANFSQRLVDAAIEQARATGVPEDHPLLRSAESVTRPSQTTRPSRRWIAGVAALAASGLFAWVALRPANLDREMAPVAFNDPIASNATDSDNSATTNGLAEPRANMLAENGTESESVNASPDRVSPDRVASSDLGPAPTESPDADRPNGMNREQAMSALANNSAPATKDSTSEPNSDSPIKKSGNASPSMGTIQQQVAVLVLDVRRTEEGRFSRPIQDALRLAGIEASRQQAVNDSIVSSVRQSVSTLEKNASEEVAGSVMYIEASAKSIDRFVAALLSDRQGVASVGLSLALDAPLLDVAQSVNPVDATAVRQSQSFEFTGELDAVSKTLARHLSDRRFLPLEGGADADAAALATSLTDDGPDVPSRVFVLVR